MRRPTTKGVTRWCWAGNRSPNFPSAHILLPQEWHLCPTGTLLLMCTHRVRTKPWEYNKIMFGTCKVDTGKPQGTGLWGSAPAMCRMLQTTDQKSVGIQRFLVLSLHWTSASPYRGILQSASRCVWHMYRIYIICAQKRHSHLVLLACNTHAIFNRLLPCRVWPSKQTHNFITGLFQFKQ